MDGHNSVEQGWRGGKTTVKQLFDEIYAKPKMEDLLRKDSFLKLNGSLRADLAWSENPMNYEGGRCIQLDLPMAQYSQTTIILKFEELENIGFEKKVELELTITGFN